MRGLKRFGMAILGLVVAMMTAATALDAHAACALSSSRSKVKHIVYIVYDNVHYRRDNPLVPSDVEQMPNMLNFLRAYGTFDIDHHDVLISHTANDIITTLTGVYSDRHGIPVANSFGVFNPPGTKPAVSFVPSFVYWTETLADLAPETKDPLPFMLTQDAQGHLKNAPAPWVPFTRAGCDYGAFSTANIEFETIPGDVNKVYGKNSPEAKEDINHQIADFEGVAVHCGKGSVLCAASKHAATDALPDEPGGYIGFKGLFGAKYVAPAVGKPAGLTDLDGNLIRNFDTNLVGFPGFSPPATQTLGAVAEMLEGGVQVVTAYIAALHEDVTTHNPTTSGNALGPGEALYVQQAKEFNKAWGQFFVRLAKDGIDQSNTLFVITADEGDHFVGGPPSPPNCDGVTIPCKYKQIGELDVDLNALAIRQGNKTPFDFHFDVAPTIHIDGDQTAADFNPDVPDSTARALELTLSKLTTKNPYTGHTDQLMAAMADPVEEKLLHMVTADPQRTPNFIFFGDPDYFFCNSSIGCTPTPTPFSPEAWNHGDFQPEIGLSWLGIAGPGVQNLGLTSGIFSDHTDIRPTILALAKLTDDYASDGRVLIETLDPSVLPPSVQSNSGTFTSLAQVYKQLNAPFGELPLDTLKVSTAALTGNSSTYTEIEDLIRDWTAERDGLVSQIKPILANSIFHGQPINQAQAQILIDQGQDLINQVHYIANP
jgi:hypothetical protein